MIDLQSKWLQYLVAVTMVALGFGIRIWPLSDLGLRIPWGTYYPSVMVGALYGGLPTGLLAR